MAITNDAKRPFAFSAAALYRGIVFDNTGPSFPTKRANRPPEQYPENPNPLKTSCMKAFGRKDSKKRGLGFWRSFAWHSLEALVPEST